MCKYIRLHSKIFSNPNKMLENVLFCEIYALKTTQHLRKEKKFAFLVSFFPDKCIAVELSKVLS
jgi:hypothetical protein